jgi:hypothetical protein
MPPPVFPKAYLITFATYGTRLPGNPKGWVDRRENQFGTSFPTARKCLETKMETDMRYPPYELDALGRPIVLAAIQEACAYRGWVLEAAHVRTKRSHCVIGAQANPEFVLDTLKSYASRKLNRAGFEPRRTKRWARHGSTKYLWSEANVEGAIQYVVEEQGEPMAVFSTKSGKRQNTKSELD